MLDTPIHKTQDKDKQNKNTTQYLLDTPIHKTQDKDKQNKNTSKYLLDTPMHKKQDKDKQNKNTSQLYGYLINNINLLDINKQRIRQTNYTQQNVIRYLIILPL